MGYTVDFDGLDILYANLRDNADVWYEKLAKLSEKSTALAESDNMSGRWADGIKSYLESVHGTIIPLIRQLIALLNYNCLIYKRDYQSNIDTDLHAHIRSEELDSIRLQIENKKRLAEEIDGEVGYSLTRVRDIFTLRYQDCESVSQAHQQTISFLVKLNESIMQLEQRHETADFTAVDEMISALRSFIAEMQGQPRRFKTDFSMTALTAVDSFQRVYNANLVVTDELEKKAVAIETAIDGENQRIADLQEEEDERQKQANTVKWIVTGICIVGSIVAIAATGGAATPLIVGAVSAASSAVIAGTNNLADQYAQNGDLNDVDWGSFGKDVVIGGVTGFVTGYLGAGIGQVANTALNTANSIGTGIVIGSVTEIGSGVITRGSAIIVEDVATSLIEGEEFDLSETLNEAKEAALDPKQIVIDGVLGGISGGVSTANAIKSEKSIITDGSQFDENGNLKANVMYKTGEHDYIYVTDDNGYIVEVHADELQLKTHEGRLANATDTYGKKTGDQAGHLIGDRFGGSPEIDNLTSQNGRLNQSDYKILENQWADAIDKGKKVSVDITVNYPKQNTGRPSSYDVSYTIDGEEFFQRFINK